MKLAIIGCGHGVGRALLEEALSAGHTVTALLRDPRKLTLTSPDLKIERGDIRDPAPVKRTVAGQDAVCICVGVKPSLRPVNVFSDGVRQVIRQLGSDSDTRLVLISGIGAGDSRGHGGWWYDHVTRPFLLRTIYADKDKAETLVRRSHTDWLIVRPAFLTDGPRTGQYRVLDDLVGVQAGQISRHDVADFVLRQLERPTHFGEAPLITY